MEVLAYVAAALVIIALTNAVAPKIGVAAPLLLVLIGIGASFIPALTGFRVDSGGSSPAAAVRGCRRNAEH
jgi:CPA1 family monovalent cation:H+ antiporter